MYIVHSHIQIHIYDIYMYIYIYIYIYIYMSISYTFQERVINFRSQQVVYLDIFICMTEHDHS